MSGIINLWLNLCLKPKKQTRHGFTIVELLIVIVVIGILAAIVVVAYRGMQERAAESVAESSITQAAKKIKIHSVTNGSYPANLIDAGIKNEPNVTYDYTAVDGGFCLSAEIKNVARSINQKGDMTTGSCELSLVKWNIAGGISLDVANSQLVLSPTQTGTATSPLIHNDGAGSVRMTTEAYVTQQAPGDPGYGRNYFGTQYFGEDKVTPVENTAGYTANGHAACQLQLNQWTTCSWNATTGPNVEWMRFIIRSSPNNYTSDNIFRNIEFTVNN